MNLLFKNSDNNSNFSYSDILKIKKYIYSIFNLPKKPVLNIFELNLLFLEHEINKKYGTNLLILDNDN